MLGGRLDVALARLLRQPSTVAVLFCDLNDFKAINDTHGHTAGDQVLVEVARRLQHLQGPGDTACRFGGDRHSGPPGAKASLSPCNRRVGACRASCPGAELAAAWSPPARSPPCPLRLVGVVLSGQPVRPDRMTDHRWSVGSPAGHAPMAALLRVPVVLDGRVLGGLYLRRLPGEVAFSDVDELIATALAGQAAAAVDAVHQRTTAQTVAAALGMTDVRAGEQPVSGEDPAASPVLQRPLSAARRTLGLELVFLSRLQQGQLTFTHLDAADHGPPLTAGGTVPVSEGYCQLMIDGQIPASVPDVAAHPVLGAMGVTAALGVGAYCGVPVRSKPAWWNKALVVRGTDDQLQDLRVPVPRP